MENKFKINGSLIEVSESNNEDYTKKYAKFLLCPLDEGNENGKGIKSEDLSEAELKTLTGQPLVTKVIYNEQTKQYDFGGHEMKTSYKIDDYGRVIKFNDFTSTNPIGYHTEVSIEDVEIDGIVKKCIVATVCLWTRYYHAMEVIKRLGNKLRTSWEVSYESTYEEGGVTWLKGILFLANCTLGTNVIPAYSDAGLLEVASKDNIMDEFEQAFIEDLKNINEDFNAEISAKNNINNNTENEGGHKNMADENKNNVELSALTSRDLRDKVRSAIYSTEGNGRWYYDILIYPYDYTAYAKIEGKDFCDEDFCKFTYVVNSDNTISLTNQEDVKMVFIPKDENNTDVAELQTSLSQKETELSNKLNDIVKLGETIKGLETSLSEKETIISELSPIKERYEQEQIEKAELEKQSKIEVLKTEALSSQYVTEEDFETSEVLKTALSELDEKVIKTFIADRVIEQASKQKKEPKEELNEKQTNNNVEISSVDLSSTQEYSYTDDLKNDSFYKILHGYK